MKVLLVSPYSENLVGGIINWTKYIVNYHREHRGEVDLSLLYNDHASQVLDAATLLSRLRVGLSNYIPVVRQFRKQLSDGHYDLAHICTSASMGLIRDLLLVQVAKKRGVSTVVHMHFGRIPQVLKSGGWERFLLLQVVKRADCVAVMDRGSLEALNNHGYENVRFVPNPLSSEVQNQIIAVGNVQRNQRKIVFAGHVIPTKGVEELIKACRGIDNIQLEILGKVPDDSYRQRLYDIAGKGYETWLNIPGNKPFESVIKEMKSCSVFVLPSYSEGFPNVILESMACGCPIVATSVGAIPEMLDSDSAESCGICCAPRDVEKLRKSILFLLEHPAEAQEYGKRAMKRVNEMYVMPKVWAQLVHIWKDFSFSDIPEESVTVRQVENDKESLG